MISLTGGIQRTKAASKIAPLTDTENRLMTAEGRRRGPAGRGDRGEGVEEARLAATEQARDVASSTVDSTVPCQAVTGNSGALKM